jgi:hypothetical protein
MRTHTLSTLMSPVATLISEHPQMSLCNATCRSFFTPSFSVNCMRWYFCWLSKDFSQIANQSLFAYTLYITKIFIKWTRIQINFIISFRLIYPNNMSPNISILISLSSLIDNCISISLSDFYPILSIIHFYFFSFFFPPLFSYS